MTETWGRIIAMEASHHWRVLRHAGVEADAKTCNSCGDNMASTARYCPGVGVEDLPSVMGEHPQLPLEYEGPFPR